MTRDTIVRSLALGIVMLSAIWVRSDGPTTRKSIDLGGAERYLTYISTDKPIYRPGEKVYIRAVALRANDRVPAKQLVQPLIEIKGPKGDTVMTAIAATEAAAAGFAWEIPSAQPGGEYTIHISHPFAGYAPAERKFDIRAYRAPRLKSQIVFLRDGYGPGDTVSASLHVERAEGGIPAGAKVTAMARVDGEEAWRGPATVDPNGNCSVSFKLPADIARGEGTLALAIEDGGALETATKTIPILLQTVDLNLYPEGGDLVAGLASRVYIEARTPARKPADIAGVIIDAAGKQVATFKTEHEGRGRFAFTPARDGKYTLRIDQPSGIKTIYPLPAVKPSGAVLSATSDILLKDQPVKLAAASTTPGTLRITLNKRDTELASTKIELTANQPAEITLTPPASADGVLIATLWDDQGKPLAERLVYRQPAKSVKVEIMTEGSEYVPADKVTLRVRTTDDSGKPVAAVLGVTVTDDAVQEMIEKREQAPRLPVMVLLESDVRELADAHVYLDEKNPKAALATDLLLGTQGWRRFAFVDSAKFLAEHGDAAKRVLALTLQHPRPFGIAHGGGGGLEGAGEWADGDMVGAKFDLRRLPADGVDVKKAEDKVAKGPVPDAPAAVAPVPRIIKKDELIAAEEIAGRKMVAGKPWAALKEAQQARISQLPFIREYAHVVRPGRVEGDRIDFAETLYWASAIKTDEQTGTATVSFHLSDAVTTFRIFADAFDSAGAIGSATHSIQSVQPFYAEPKLPLEVTSGDTIQLPIGLVNGMGRDLPLVKLQGQVPGGITIAAVEDGFTLKSRQRIRRLMKLDVGAYSGSAPFTLIASAGPFTDKISRTLAVQPMGFPVEDAHGGLLADGSPITRTITVPENIVKGSTSSSITVYPTPLANLTGALERLIQEPSGCFEQTSSTSYPLVMAQQYFMGHQGVDPKLIERSRQKLDGAYQRLAGFECKQKGYEWFGGDPGHEALTAYGLMQFVDMAQVRDVSQKMIQRTRAWLLARRDGKGGFARNARALDSFGGAPEPTTNAYITWALTESGEKGLDKEIQALKQSSSASEDSYVIALAANVLALKGDNDAAKKLMHKLVGKQKDDGFVDGAVTSITRSGGEALQIETTALAILAWMRDPSYAAHVEKAIKWLAESCKSGRFGSTQSTILALRAIIAYDKSRARPKAAGAITLLIDGKPFGQPVAFAADTQGAITLPDISDTMKPGRHTVELRMDKGSPMPAAMTVKFYATQPPSSEKCPLAIKTALRNDALQEGAITEIAVTVANRTKDVLPTPIAIIGVPGGLEVRHDQLKELVKSEKIDAYEVIGRNVVLYWRCLKADQKVELPLSLVAAVPGAYTAPASRAYLYYTDEHKTWTPGVKVTIR